MREPVYIFDIETERGDDDTIRAFAKPFVKPDPPAPFDPAQVKVGNLKDQAKIDAKIAEAREQHQQAVLAYPQQCAQAETDHWKKIIEDAALNPVTGRIVVIGVRSSGGAETIIDGDEKDILSQWWSRWERMRESGAMFVGCNSHDFDLPFIRIRSWINSVAMPSGIRENRYWHRSFIDLRQEWLCGRRYSDCESSLGHIAKVLGIGEKLPGDIAANFGRYWREDRDTALAYLRRDLELTCGIARRLGFISEKAA